MGCAVSHIALAIGIIGAAGCLAYLWWPHGRGERLSIKLFLTFYAALIVTLIAEVSIG